MGLGRRGCFFLQLRRSQRTVGGERQRRAAGRECEHVVLLSLVAHSSCCASCFSFALPLPQHCPRPTLLARTAPLDSAPLSAPHSDPLPVHSHLRPSALRPSASPFVRPRPCLSLPPSVFPRRKRPWAHRTQLRRRRRTADKALRLQSLSEGSTDRLNAFHRYRDRHTDRQLAHVGQRSMVRIVEAKQFRF